MGDLGRPRLGRLAGVFVAFVLLVPVVASQSVGASAAPKTAATTLEHSAWATLSLSTAQVAAQHAAETARGLKKVAGAIPGVTFVPPPPQGFNPLAATNAQLLAYGFPPAPPRTSTGYSAWAAAVRSDHRYVPDIWESSAAKTNYSTNWSGYQDNTSPFDAAYVEYTIPTNGYHSGSVTSYEDSWVGVQNPTLIQTGSTATAAPGFPIFGTAWWENYNGHGGANYDYSTYYNSGDTIFAEVYAENSTRSKWLFYVTDVTHSNDGTLSTIQQLPQNCTCTDAVFILEKAYPYLSDFGQVNFSSATAAIGSNYYNGGSLPNNSWTMTVNLNGTGGTYAYPSGWSNSANFSVIRGTAGQ